MIICLNKFVGLTAISSALILFPITTFAQLEFNAGSSLDYIENPQRENSSDETDLLSTNTVGVTSLRQTKLFDTTFNYTANSQEYSENLLNDRSRVEGNGSVTWKAMPEFLSWRVSNSRSNQLINASQPDVSDNRQIIDYTATGPSIVIPFQNSTYATFDANFGIVGYEESEQQNQNRNTYSFNITRIISQAISASIRSTYTTTEFDESLIPGYSFYDISGNIQLRNIDYEISAEIGEYKTNRSGQESSHPTFRVDGLYRINSRLEITGEFTKSIDDLVSDINNQGRIDQFFQDSDATLGQTFGNSNLSNIYKRESASIGANYTIESLLNIGVRYSQNQRSSIVSSGEENDDRLSINLRLPLPQLPRVTINSSAVFSERDFAIDRAIQSRTDFRLGAAYQLTERLSLLLSFFESNQSSDLIADNYDSRNLSLGLSFTR